MDITEHINTCMQYEPVSELPGYVVMVWRTERYAVLFMQDNETLFTMMCKLRLALNTQVDANN
jgi:hypothetical protein